MWLLIPLLLITNACFANFSFHLNSEPLSLDPAHLRGVSGQYLHHALYQNLLKYDNERGLIPSAAKKCSFKNKLTVVCKLKKNLVFSNNKPIKAENFVWAFDKLFASSTKTTVTQLFLNLKNAKQILAGKVNDSSLGVKAVDDFTLEFQLAQPDPDFLYNLLHSATAPLPERNYNFPKSNLITSGPYKIQSWKPGFNLVLTNNKLHSFKNSNRPNIDIYFLESHETALQLYSKGTLKFLKLLSTVKIPKFQKSPEFFFSPMLRFDYIGFGEELKPFPLLRKALLTSVDFKHTKTLLNAKEAFGCAGLPSSFTVNKICYKFAPKRAKELLLKENPNYKNVKLKLHYSVAGGESIKTAMEWLQNQWKQHLGLSIQLVSVERGMLVSTIKTLKPSLFRKGVEMVRPTCLSTLEIFSKGNPSNYIQLDNSKFQTELRKLQTATNRQQCTRTLKALLNADALLPLGEMHFAMLAKPEYSGFKINYLNQLDLTNLKAKSVSK